MDEGRTFLYPFIGAKWRGLRLPLLAAFNVSFTILFVRGGFQGCSLYLCSFKIVFVSVSLRLTLSLLLTIGILDLR